MLHTFSHSQYLQDYCYLRTVIISQNISQKTITSIDRANAIKALLGISLDINPKDENLE